MISLLRTADSDRRRGWKPTTWKPSQEPRTSKIVYDRRPYRIKKTLVRCWCVFTATRYWKVWLEWRCCAQSLHSITPFLPLVSAPTTASASSSRLKPPPIVSPWNRQTTFGMVETIPSYTPCHLEINTSVSRDAIHQDTGPYYDAIIFLDTILRTFSSPCSLASIMPW